ncbi:hypothetical protein [Candidatus Amarolinea dominans]|uniref:hypothetical protein n=1 Tax=Candidatus Amarolinea dominans TaxID=3140696 RepID=UPI001DB44D36|nr:hypothetical protein [Anaerolineae bacterium]
MFITATKLTTAANAIFLQYTAPIYVLLLGWWLLEGASPPRRLDRHGCDLQGLLLFLGDDLTLQGLRQCAGYPQRRAPGRHHPGHAGRNARDAGRDFSPGLSHRRGDRAARPAAGHLLAVEPGDDRLPGRCPDGPALDPLLGRDPACALEASLILTLEPVLNPLWVFLVIGEAPGQLALAGAALVVLALTGRAWVSARNS